MKLMMPPGELLAKVEAEPPRIASMRSRLSSARRKMSALPKAMSPNSSTGSPSSCSCRNLAPPEATGRPRTAMLALPSPPLDSERMPGMLRKISAVERGVDCSIASAPTVLTDTLDLSLLLALAVPVTNTESRLTTSPCVGVDGATGAAASWAKAAGAASAAATAQVKVCRRVEWGCIAISPEARGEADRPCM